MHKYIILILLLLHVHYSTSETFCPICYGSSCYSFIEFGSCSQIRNIKYHPNITYGKHYGCVQQQYVQKGRSIYEMKCIPMDEDVCSLLAGQVTVLKYCKITEGLSTKPSNGSTSSNTECRNDSSTPSMAKSSTAASSSVESSTDSIQSTRSAARTDSNSLLGTDISPLSHADGTTKTAQFSTNTESTRQIGNISNPFLVLVITCAIALLTQF